MKHNKNVLLLGSYGQSNLGDDLLMTSYIRLLKNVRPDIRITINVNDKALIGEDYLNDPKLSFIETYQTSPLRLAKIVYSSDCVIYGGGTIFKELYKSTGRKPYAVIFRIMLFNIFCWLVRTPVLHLNIGIGVLETAIGKLISKVSIQLSAYTSFRDKKSIDIARNVLRIRRGNLRLTCDALFLNPDWIQKVPKASKSKKQVIGFNVVSDVPNHINREEYIKACRNTIKKLLDVGYEVVLIPFQIAFNKNSDLHFMKNHFLPVDERVRIVEKVDYSNINQILDTVDVFVCSRFHAMLLSAARKLPMVALMYDSKCERLIQEMNYPYALVIDAIEPSAVLEAINDVSNDVQALYNSYIEKQQENARRDIAIVKKYVV